MELQNSTARRPERRRHKRETEDRFLPIRQWLNIIFMLGALVGVILYFHFLFFIVLKVFTSSFILTLYSAHCIRQRPYEH